MSQACLSRHSEVNRSPADSHFLRNTFGRFASGVTVVSCNGIDGTHGMTANSFVSISLDPARAMISIARASRAHALMSESAHFGLSMLRADQEYVSRHFAGKPVDGFSPRFEDSFGAPILADALAWMVCARDQSFEIGDHTLFVGRITACDYDPGADPLIFFGGQYASLPEHRAN